MAHLLAFMSVILLLAVFSSIVCPSSKMFNERRDRAPYIEPIEHSAQYLSESAGSRLKKGPIHNKEQSPVQTHNPSGNNEAENTDAIVEKNIRSVFSTNFGPGVYLFNNTAPLVSQTHFNSIHDQMVGDQPVSYAPPSSPSPSGKEFFKVQRSPDGKLSLVYNEDYVLKAAKDRLNSGSSVEKSDRIYQTHFSDGLTLKNENRATPAPSQHSVDHLFHLQPNIDDCLEHDEIKNNKTFCSRIRNYPTNKDLDELIKENFPNLGSFLNEDIILPKEVGQRMNNAPNEEYLCRSRERVIYPQSGQNKDYDWIYIVNSPQYKQGIRVEECINVNKPCGEQTGLSLPNHYKATCEQNYIYRSLIAYKNQTIYKDTFRIPSCCKCVLRSS